MGRGSVRKEVRQACEAVECERKCHWNQCSERVEGDGVESEGGEGMRTSYVYE